jgi:hypothetical protein
MVGSGFGSCPQTEAMHALATFADALGKVSKDGFADEESIGRMRCDVGNMCIASYKPEWKRGRRPPAASATGGRSSQGAARINRCQSRSDLKTDWSHSESFAPEPPSSAGRSTNFGRPSAMDNAFSP